MLSKLSQCPLSSVHGSCSHLIATNKIVARTRLVQCPAGARQQNSSCWDQEGNLGAEQQQRLRTAVIATAVCCAFVSNVAAARASDSWVPRRHHRHIGERFTDTWADSIVEVRNGRSHERMISASLCLLKKDRQQWPDW